MRHLERRIQGRRRGDSRRDSGTRTETFPRCPRRIPSNGPQMTEKMDQVQGFYLETQEFREARQRANKGPSGRPPERALKRIHKLASRDGWTCKLCGDKISSKTLSGPLRPTADHIVPRSLGGSNALWNLQLAHALCNERRGNKPLDSDS